jgi:hypothetical protein
MLESTKQLAYALHDIYGYHEDEESNAVEIERNLNSKGYYIVSNWELRDLEECMNCDR